MRFSLCCFAFCVLALTNSPSHAQGVVVSEYDLKAAYLYHFMQFTDWPESMQRAGKSLQLCIEPNNPLLRAVKAIENKIVHGQSIVVKIESASSREHCQVAIVGRTDSNAADNAVEKNNLIQAHTLTIADDPRGGLDDAIIRMWIEDGRILFSINNTRARERGLEISSKLLRLAGSVQ